MQFLFRSVPTPTSSSVYCPRPFQAPINAQMLAQRQREILNQHLRQRQMHHQQQQVQQRTLMMRGQGLNLTPSVVAPSGVPATMSNPRIPQANAQQFPFPPNYGMGPRPPPPLTTPFFPGFPHCPGSQLFVWIPGEPGYPGDARKPGRAAGAHQESPGPVQYLLSLSSATTLSLSTGLTLRITGLGGHV